VRAGTRPDQRHQDDTVCRDTIRDATTLIPDGAWIEVDGGTGTVRILAGPPGRTGLADHAVPSSHAARHAS